VALFRCTGPAGGSAAPAPRDSRASAATRHDNLLAVRHERREVDELELRLPRRSAGAREGIRDTRPRLQAIETGPTHRADDVDEDLRPLRAGRARGRTRDVNGWRHVRRVRPQRRAADQRERDDPDNGRDQRTAAVLKEL
jgi:hypothetical protein